MPALPTPSVILFDWDDTLVSSWQAIFESTNATLVAMGHPPWDQATARKRIGRSLREVFPEMFGAKWEKAADIFYEAFETHHIASLIAKTEAQPLLDTIAAQKIPTGIISNKTGRYLREEVAHLGWQGYFRAIVGAGDARSDKPDPAVMNHALKAMKLDGLLEDNPPGIWYVGDRPVDIELATATGSTPIIVRDHGSNIDFAAQHLYSLTELKNLVMGA